MSFSWIKKIMTRCVNAGVNKVPSERFARKVKLTNLICMTLALVTLPYAGVFYMVGATTLALLVVPISSIYALFVVANHFGKVNLSRFGIIAVFSTAILIYSMAFGAMSGIQILYFPVACFAFVLFERTERSALAFGITLPIVLTIFLRIYGFEHPFVQPVQLNEDVLKLILLALHLTTFAILLATVYFLYAANEKSEIQLNNLLTALTASEARSQAILSAVPDVIFLVNTAGICMDMRANEKELNLLFGGRVVLGEHLSTFLPQEFKNHAAGLLLLAILSEQMQNASFVTERDGQPRHFEARIVKSGQEGALFFIQNVTERMMALKTIASQQSKMLAASKLSALGEMSAGIAHEINNPLAIITGNAHRLMRALSQGDIDAAKAKELTLNIESTAQRIAKIIKGLLSFARSDENESLAPWPLENIVQDTLALCQERYRKRGIEILLKGEFSKHSLNCRPAQVSQVLLNLLNNAYDALEHLPNSWVVIKINHDSEKIEVGVTDSGPGIPKGVVDKIFQPFFTTKEIGKGTGLGLSISKGIMESHGGELELDILCENTSFIMRFPTENTQFK